jgi:hypothetical protein
MEQLQACFSAFQKQFGVFESTQNEHPFSSGHEGEQLVLRNLECT